MPISGTSSAKQNSRQVVGIHRGIAVDNTVPLTANTTLTAALHGGKHLIVNKADGAAITLPAATGSGVRFVIILGTTISSNSTTIKVANASDTMVGYVESATATGATTNGFAEAAAGTDDTITMNGTTTGGIVGSRVECIDIATNLWYVDGQLLGSGTLATSLSATV